MNKLSENLKKGGGQGGGKRDKFEENTIRLLDNLSFPVLVVL